MREAAQSRGEQCAPMDRLARSLQGGFSSPMHGTDIAVEAQGAKLQRVGKRRAKRRLLPNSFFVKWRLHKG